MILVEVVQQLALAILLGALIGLEREHTRQVHNLKGLPIFGVRTTIIFSILGFSCAFVSKITNNTNIITLGALIAIVFSTVVYVSNVWTKKYTGSTTYAAMLIVFFLGVLAGIGGRENMTAAGIIAIITTVFLASRKNIVGFAKKLTNEEIFAALKFGIIAFIVMPLLPNSAIDPWGVINPAQIWFVVVAVSTISFLSYILMRMFSYKGLLVSSFFGGFVSGSATTYQIADWVRQKKSLLSFAKPSILLACLTGHVGDLIVIFFVLGNILLLKKVAFAYLIGVSCLIILAFMFYKRHTNLHELKLTSPFALMPALKFGALYVGLILLGFWLRQSFGAVGLLPVVIAGSFISSSAVIASMATLSKDGGLGLDAAAQMVILAMVISLLIKYFWVQPAQNKELSRTVLITTAITSIAVCAAFLFSQRFF